MLTYQRVLGDAVPCNTRASNVCDLWGASYDCLQRWGYANLNPGACYVFICEQGRLSFCIPKRTRTVRRNIPTTIYNRGW